MFSKFRGHWFLPRLRLRAVLHAPPTSTFPSPTSSHPHSAIRQDNTEHALVRTTSVPLSTYTTTDHTNTTLLPPATVPPALLAVSQKSPKLRRRAWKSAPTESPCDRLSVADTATLSQLKNEQNDSSVKVGSCCLRPRSF